VRIAKVFNFGIYAGDLIEDEKGAKYRFIYCEEYSGPPVSLTLPSNRREYDFNKFPPFFEGLLPEGVQLEALLRMAKIDSSDFFSILTLTGKDLVGSVTVEESA
jgi:serine/threonine-protein kinase HipA